MPDPSFDLWTNFKPVVAALVFVTLPLFGLFLLLEKIFRKPH
jgi:hypothetical protein